MMTSEYIFEQAASFLGNGTGITIVTVTAIGGNTPAIIGEKMIVPPEGVPVGTIGGGALERQAIRHCRERKPEPLELRDYDLASLGMTCGGTITLLYEYFPAKSYFVLFGGGHVGSALAPILESIGFNAVIFDNRPEIVERHAASGRSVFLCDYKNIGETEKYLKSGRCFIATHNHLFDTDILKQVLQADIQEYHYVGMIGSKNKVAGAFAEIKEAGITLPPQVYAPVGLPVGGGTPAEIAISIAAEILAVTYDCEVPHMRLGSG